MRNIVISVVFTFSTLTLAHSQQALEKFVTAASQPASTADFYGIGFAMGNVNNIMMTENLEIALNPVVWNQPVRANGHDKYASVNADQFLEFSKRGSTFDIVTVNKRTERATATVFENGKPASHTVITSSGEYTATPFFCELLREQTGSKSFKELSEKALSCNDFYNRTKINEATEALLKDHLSIHSKNMNILKNSAAQSMVKTGGDGTRFEALLRGLGLKPSAGGQKPRALLNRSASAGDIDDRKMIQDIGEACGRLWVDGRGWRSSAPASTPSPTKQ